MQTTKTYKIQLFIVFSIIAICEVFFLLDVAFDFFWINPALLWFDHSDLELISSIALAVALVAIGLQIKSLLAKNKVASDSVKVASGELLAVIYAAFDTWKLSPSERDIALLLIKGLSAQEIADVRNTKLGTIKSQSSAVYQKAGLKGRHELVSYFVEDLLASDGQSNSSHGSKALSMPV